MKSQLISMTKIIKNSINMFLSTNGDDDEYNIKYIC